MSASRTLHYTPRSSASQGRIVTANSTLSAQLRDDSGRQHTVPPASGDSTSATNPLALNVVSSSPSVVNSSSSINPNQSDLDKVQYVVVSKSRTSLNTNADANDNISVRNTKLEQSGDQEQSVNSANTNQFQSSDLHDKGRDSVEEQSRGDLSNRYSYYSLKRSGNVSRTSTNTNALINQSHAALNGAGVYGGEDNLNVNSESSNPEGEREHNSESASILRSEYPAQPAHSGAPGIAQSKASFYAQQKEKSVNEHSLNAQQHTRLSLYSQHGGVLKEPHSVDIRDQSVPPLDLSRLSGRKSPESDSVSPTPQTVQQNYHDQNLHASDQKSPLVHFTPHDYHHTARTYEVDTPYTAKQLPHVTSSTNFRGPSDTYRDRGGPQPLDQDPYREQRPSKAGSLHSDLADDLKIPYQFDTQAQQEAAGQSNREPKPPSPPIPVSPPPEKQPATSLRSNSQVYAVANPDIQRAQGFDPPQNNHYTPRQYSQRRSESGVRFDSASKQRSASRDQNSPVRDRAPTPYNRSPPRSPGEYQPRSPPGEDRYRSKPESRNTLPPQHPPLDTKHSHSTRTSAKTEWRQEFGKQLDDAASIKRVYVESPTFTKEEEEEYRFVNSRIEDHEEKDQSTFREMDRNRDNSRNNYDRNRDNDRNRDRESDYNYKRNQVEQDRYSDKNRDRYEDRNNGRYEDRNRDMNGYNDDRQRDNYRENDRNGYRENDRYEDRNKYDPYNSQDTRYDRLKDERSRYDREPYREEDPDMRQGFRKQNTEMDVQELQREQEYQRELKKRIDKQKIKDNDYIPPHERGNFDRENFARDSLEYPDERERGFARDSLDYNNVHGQEWGDPPQNPYQERQDPYYQQDYPQQQYMKEDSKPAFYDAEDAAKMEVVNPPELKYDYVNLNKQDYGVPPKRSYRDIVHKKKEEEDKLEKIFITPKVPPKHGKKKKAQSAQPEHMGYQPPVQDQYPLGFKPSSAEELWAMRSHTLQNQSAGSKKGKGSANKPKKWNSNPNITYKHNFQAPPPLPNQGQTFKPPNMNYPNSPTGQSNQAGQQAGYTTPTRHLQPIENKPAPPVSTEFVPTALEPNSPFRRHMELKPITQEIVTDDGQRISVDINLRLVSPPPGQGSPPPGQQQQQQLALVPVQETQGHPDQNQRPIGVPYTLQDQYGYDNGFQAYQELRRQQLRDSLLTSSREKKSVSFGEVQDNYHGNGPLGLEGRYQDIEDQIAHEQMALAEQTGNTGYAKRHATGSTSYREEEGSDIDSGYTALYHKNRSKDPNEKPWYKIYDIHDYKKMQREVRLNRGTLGPDLDTEPYKEKLEKRHKQFEYARLVMEKNKNELGHKKPPAFPRHPQKDGEENVKRKAALDYAKTVPKPTVKARPNQYNSYEVAAQLGAPGLSPKARNSPASTKSPPPAKTVDVIDIHSLQQRHLQERKTADKIRQNMEAH